MDRLTPQQRHYNMTAIQMRDTMPEMVVRKWLWKNGFRYRTNHKRLPGRPDIVLLKYRTCIFVNGCFWHGHNVAEPRMSDGRCKMEDVIESSECCKIPKSNTEFWVNKIRRNKERDVEVQKELAAMGWHCITIWECELKPKVREKTLESLVYTLNKIFLQDHSVRCKMDDVRCKKEDVRCKMDDVRCNREDVSPSTDSGTSKRAYSVPEEEPMMAAEEEDV